MTLNASEARQIAKNFNATENNIRFQEIIQLIQNEAQTGGFSITVDDNLNSAIVESLKNIGYSVFPSSFENTIDISWG